MGGGSKGGDDPTLGLDDEAFGMIGTFDNLDRQIVHRAGGAVAEHGTRVGAGGSMSCHSVLVGSLG